MKKKIFNIKIKQYFSDFLLFALGVVSAGFGLKGFLLPNNFIDGGVTGISLIVSSMFHLPLSILLLIFNLPFIVLGYTQISREFAIKSILTIIGLAFAVYSIPYPVVTSDKLLVATFGGVFLGAGIGLSVRGGAVLDGTEVLALYLSRKTGVTIGDIILIFNVFIFSAGAYFLSVEIALYAILTYVVASKAVDFVIRGIEEHTGVTIVSPQSEKIRKMIVLKMGRGATVYSGKGGFEKDGGELKSYNIIFTVLTRLEVAKLQAEIEIIDPTAFVIMNSVKDTHGGMVKRVGINKK